MTDLPDIYCHWCSKRVKGLGWEIIVQKKREVETHRGLYCSKRCAETDAYGPVFRGATIQRRSK